jgi:hypothetical protein
MPDPVSAISIVLFLDANPGAYEAVLVNATEYVRTRMAVTLPVEAK